MKSPLRFLVLLTLALLWTSSTGIQAREPFRVGVLFWHSSPNDEKAFEGVRSGFELAGIPVHFTRADAGEDRERAKALLTDWRDRKFDLVYAMGTSAALRAKEVLTELPVVFTAVTNPVGSGVVLDWSGSGTNLCGNSNWISTPTLLKVFKDTVPDLARLGVVLNRVNPVSIEEVAEARRHFAAEPEKRLALYEEWIEDPTELEEAVRRVLKRGAQAVWVPIDYDVYRHLDRVAAITDPLGIPIVTSQASAVRDGAVAGVAVDYLVLGERSVILAEQVLRQGKAPGDLAVGRMKSYRVLVNLAAARQAGFEIPLGLLATADEILDPKEEER
jgi:putative tryptophan/tyrosine transport system substrate-binding protein